MLASGRTSGVPKTAQPLSCTGHVPDSRPQRTVSTLPPDGQRRGGANRTTGSGSAAKPSAKPKDAKVSPPPTVTVALTNNLPSQPEAPNGRKNPWHASGQGLKLIGTPAAGSGCGRTKTAMVRCTREGIGMPTASHTCGSWVVTSREIHWIICATESVAFVRILCGPSARR